jgi:hypothetical protein
LDADSQGGVGMMSVLKDLLMFSCLAALITGIVIEVASVPI